MCTLRGCQFLHVFFNVCLDLYCHQRSNYQEIQLNGLTLPHFCACSKPGPGFPIKLIVNSILTFNNNNYHNIWEHQLNRNVSNKN